MRTVLKLKDFYFFVYGATGAMIPFLNLYLARVGLTGTQIGIVTSVFPLVLIFAAPFWGILSDMTHLHQRILHVSLMATIPFVIGIAFTTRIVPLIFLMIGYAVFFAAVMPLVDNLALQTLGKEQHGYGRLRVWGAIGWGVSPPIVGFLIDRLGIRTPFYGFVFFMLASIAVIVRIPRFHSNIPRSTLAKVGNLLSKSSWQTFLLCIFLIGICSHVLEHYFVLFLDNLGGSEGNFGISITMASVSEIPIYLLAVLLIRRFGPRGLLLSAFAVYSLRAFLYAQIRTPIWAIPAQLMHGPSFSALWAGAVAYSGVQAGKELGATAQSLFNSVFMGIAASVGAFLGGLLYDQMGLAQTFRLCGLLAFIGFLLFLFLSRKSDGRSTHLRS